MRYCDRCGAAITSGGHKSCASGIFGTPYICDDCYDKEVATGAALGKAALSIGVLLGRLFIGILIGLGEIIGVCAVLKRVAGNMPDASASKLLVGVEVAAIVCFLVSKIGARILRNCFFQFLLRIVAYFTFWLSLVFGVGLYFILKYAI